MGLAGRLLDIGFAAARLGWLFLLTAVTAPALLLRSWFGPQVGPRILRRYFERCGGGYVKVGQLLATRYDLLRVEYCEELGRLFYALRPVPEPRIRQVFERSLGMTLTDAFRSFETAPIATASLAQVHGAVLWTGESVVVKVLKPGIRRTLAVDLAFLRLTARVLHVLPVLQQIDVRGLVAELSRTATEELDLAREALNTAHIHQLMAADRVAHYAPRVYRRFSNRDVLTIERIYGVTVREILSAVNAGDEATIEAWAAQGITPQRTAVILIRSVLEQTMRFRAFNADPHPSNLIVSPGGVLNWVDFGLVGWVDERQWELQLELRDAFVNGNLHAAYLALLEAMEPLPRNRDLRPFEQDIKQSLRDYLIASQDPDAPLNQKSTGSFFMRTLSALRRHRLPVTTSTVQLYRTILIADMVMLRLYPEIDWVGHLSRFLDDISGDLLLGALRQPASSPYTMYRIARTPVAMADTVDWITRRLPQLGRDTLEALSVGERSILVSLRFLRGATLVGVLGAAFVGLFRPDPPAVPLLAGLVAGVLEHPWLSLGTAVALLLGINAFIRRLEVR